ncbi:hypothetical protein BJ875DRAFT_488412 [Amylocarpus encephaloides]|uniref:Uncharacterized protein n=1 Tax=Amylocarpus encephaloides TaxID=45428 RepID=A0A9P7YA57_9HELO|nr:hypothetical protein BJ875DRAFT_488412 [Amylocarpus encephaloides]
MSSEKPENPWYLGHVLTWNDCHNDSTSNSARPTLRESLTARRLSPDIAGSCPISLSLDHQSSARASSAQYRHPSLTPSLSQKSSTAPQNNCPKPRHHPPNHQHQFEHQENHQHDTAIQISPDGLVSRANSATMSKAVPRFDGGIMDPAWLREHFPHLADSTLSDANIESTIKIMETYRDACFLPCENDTENHAEENNKGAGGTKRQDASSSKERNAEIDRTKHSGK